MQLYKNSVLIVLCIHFQSGFCCPSSNYEKDSKVEQTNKTSTSASSTTNFIAIQPTKSTTASSETAGKCMILFF